METQERAQFPAQLGNLQLSQTAACITTSSRRSFANWKCHHSCHFHLPKGTDKRSLKQLSLQSFKLLVINNQKSDVI